jgi:hypothetical protein
MVYDVMCTLIIDEALAAYYDIRNLLSVFNIKFSWVLAASILVCDERCAHFIVTRLHACGS